MALKDTVERLRRLQDEPEAAGDIVERWRSAVSDLYDRVTTWLAPYVEDGTMVLTRHPKTAHEERTGSYAIDALDIDVGPETVRLDPRGAVVIGARGRVDMTLLGRGDPVLLILTTSDVERVWLVVERSRRATLIPLTQDVFETTLDGLLDDVDLLAGPPM